MVLSYLILQHTTCAKCVLYIHVCCFTSKMYQMYSVFVFLSCCNTLRPSCSKIRQFSESIVDSKLEQNANLFSIVERVADSNGGLRVLVSGQPAKFSEYTFLFHVHLLLFRCCHNNITTWSVYSGC